MFNYFRKRRIQSALENNKRRHQFLEFSKINSVLILFDYDDLESIMPVARDLVKHKKRVYLWTSTTVKGHSDKIYDFSGQSIRVVTPENQSRLFILSDAVLKEFRTIKIDMLMDMSCKDDEVLKLLLVSNPALFVIGFKEQSPKVYDFIYLKNEEQNFVDAYEDLKNYLGIYVTGNK